MSCVSEIVLFRCRYGWIMIWVKQQDCCGPYTLLSRCAASHDILLLVVHLLQVQTVIPRNAWLSWRIRAQQYAVGFVV